MPARYDHVIFKSYSETSDEFEDACTVYLVNGKLIYEGPDADDIKKAIEDNDMLKPYLKAGGYALLAQMPQAFTGSYF